MRIVLTGGSGFLAVSVAKRLSAQGVAADEILLTDLVRHPRLDELPAGVTFVQADLTDASKITELISDQTTAVYHFASLVSGGAEANFPLGLAANVQAPMLLLERCREVGTTPRFIFPSSIATFGGERLPTTIDDWTHQHPQNSYGVAKVIIEQLMNDYTRKGYVDARGVRLPAIIVRDEPNTAASGYASGIIRECAQGADYVCPVASDTRLPVLSINRCVDLLVELGAVDGAALGDYRTVNGPGLAPTAAEIYAAVQAVCGDQAGAIRYEPDPAVMSIVATWPHEMRFERAASIGLRADTSTEAIVREYLADLPEQADNNQAT